MKVVGCGLDDNGRAWVRYTPVGTISWLDTEGDTAHVAL